MRFRISNRSLPLYPTVHRRSFLQATAQAKEPAIFENSLEKTLDVHRLTNRRSLIRRIVPRVDPQKPNPPTPSAKKPAARYLLESSESFRSQAPSSDTTQSATRQYVPTSRRKFKKPGGYRYKRHPTLTTTSVFPSIDWEVKAGKTQQCPWLEKVEQKQRIADGISQLEAEVCALETYFAPSAREEEVADQVTTDVTGLIVKGVNHFEPPNPIRTSFMTSHSVLDLIITFSNQELSTADMKKSCASHTEKLRRYRELLGLAQRSLGQSSDYETLLNTRQKHIAVLHKPTGLGLRLFCAEDKPAHIEYTQDFHAEYPMLRPLYVAIRLILEARGLFGTMKSCIDTNDLQVLIAAFLKINHGRFRRDTGCAESLLAFLHTFSSEVDLRSTGVSTDPPGYFNADSLEEAYAKHNSRDLPAYLRGQRTLINTKKTALRKGNRPLAMGLLIQAPGNYMSRVNSSCSRTVELQAAFADAYKRLKNALDAWSLSQRLAPSTSILNNVMRANFDDFAARRVSILAGSRAS